MEQLTQLLDKLSAKLGVAVDVLWAALMRQAVISATSDLVFYAVVAGFVFVVTKYVQLVHKKVSEHDWEEDAWLPCGIAVVCAVVLVFISVANISNTVAGFFNPEYWALQKILSK